jgi:hypothetical protein
MSDKSSIDIENFSSIEIQQPYETVFENYSESSESSLIENYNQVNTSVGGILDKVNQSFVYLKESNINNGYGFESHSFINHLTGEKTEEILCSNGSCGLPNYKLYSNYDPNYESAYGFYAPSFKQQRSKSFKDLTPRSDKPLMTKPKREAIEPEVSGAPIYGRYAPVDISNSKVSSEITPKKRSASKKVAKEASKKVAKEASKKVAKEVAKKEAKKATKKEAKKAAKKEAKKAAKKEAKKAAKKEAKKASKESSTKSSSKSSTKSSSKKSSTLSKSTSVSSKSSSVSSKSLSVSSKRSSTSSKKSSTSSINKAFKKLIKKNKK